MESMKIVKLTAENVKRLSAVEVTPDGNLVVVGGANSAGKSSLLDSIMYALAGSKTIPDMPIRRGEKSGKIVVELDGAKRLTVERTLTPAGGSLVIKTAEGFKAPSPQKILDDLCGKIAFDPLEFSRMKPEKQAEVLRGLVGIDFAEADAKRKWLYDKRTDVNREVKTIGARLSIREIDESAPDEEVSLTDLLAERDRRKANNDAYDEAERRLNESNEAYEKAKKALQEAEEVRLARTKAFSDLVREDVDEIGKQISTAEETNAAVRENKQTKEFQAEYDKKALEAEGYTDSIAEIDAKKEAQLAAVKWPVPGLGFGETGVTLNGLPLDQAGGAELIRLSVAIGLAFNPTLRVLLIRDASLIDEDGMALIAKMAQEADAQLWIERVGEGTECSVIIEDGHVKAAAENGE